jgi:hypothetical protein
MWFAPRVGSGRYRDAMTTEEIIERFNQAFVKHDPSVLAAVADQVDGKIVEALGYSKTPAGDTSPLADRVDTP